MGVADYKKLKVQELKDELTKRGLSTEGLKAALVERLEDADKTDKASAPASTAAPAPQDEPKAPTDPPVTAEPPASDDQKAPGPVPESASGAATDVDKKKQRAERFGVPVALSDQEKRKLRAERFGIVDSNGAKKGQAANGTSNGSTAKVSEEDIAKRKARAERFGMPVAKEDKGKDEGAKGAVDPADDDKKKKRQERFASEDELKKKARVERFKAST